MSNKMMRCTHIERLTSHIESIKKKITTMSTTITSTEVKDLYNLVVQLTIPEQRESALVELCKRRESFPDLAPVLWHSFGAISALLQEIISIYPLLSPPTLSSPASNRVCNALALLQCVASHAETKSKLVKSQIPLYLYPFLNTVSRHRPFEYLRLTSLGVIGALVKVDDPEIVAFLLQTEIIPLCLRIMETGSELSKTVATFIVQKILLDDAGLTYICATAERFYAVSSVLASMVTKLIEAPSARLLKHIVRCYLRLSENSKAQEALRQCLPSALKDQTFASTINADESVQKWLISLLKSLALDDASVSTATTTATSITASSSGNSNATLSGHLPGNTAPGILTGFNTATTSGVLPAPGLTNTNTNTSANTVSGMPIAPPALVKVNANAWNTTSTSNI